MTPNFGNEVNLAQLYYWENKLLSNTRNIAVEKKQPTGRDDGHLNISNVLAENAIRPFAIGRKAWLFADTTRGANASATCYSLIETAKANNLEPYAYILHILNHIGCADTLEKVEASLPWNVPKGITQK